MTIFGDGSDFLGYRIAIFSIWFVCLLATLYLVEELYSITITFITIYYNYYYIWINEKSNTMTDHMCNTMSCIEINQTGNIYSSIGISSQIIHFIAKII